MKLMIIGHGRHGKDTAAEMICELTGLSFISSSVAVAEAIFTELNRRLEFPYMDFIESYGDRHNHRMLWKELISKYNEADKANLCKLILKHSDIYVGMRCPLEFKASRKLVDHVIWVDASERQPVDPSMGIQFDSQTMYRLDNNGTTADLIHNIMDLVSGLKLCDYDHKLFS